MIFPLLCPLSSFKIQTVSSCQLSCLWLTLCLLLSSKFFLSPLIFRVVRASLRHLFPHASFVLIHGCLFLFRSLQTRESLQLVVLPPRHFRYAWGLSFPRDRSGLGFCYSTAQAVPQSPARCIINTVAAWSSHTAFSLFQDPEFCSQFELSSPPDKDGLKFGFPLRCSCYTQVSGFCLTSACADVDFGCTARRSPKVWVAIIQQFLL